MLSAELLCIWCRRLSGLASGKATSGFVQRLCVPFGCFLSRSVEEGGVSGHLTPWCHKSMSNAPCTHLGEAAQARASWNALVAQCCVMQLRCGWYIQLGNVNRIPYKALVKWCVLCQRRSSSIATDVLCSCPCFGDARGALPFLGLDCGMLSLLTASPHQGFDANLQWPWKKGSLFQQPRNRCFLDSTWDFKLVAG